ncbi:MAG: hypothetical protein ABW168_22395 [Sedimenticola sp.]
MPETNYSVPDTNYPVPDVCMSEFHSPVHETSNDCVLHVVGSSGSTKETISHDITMSIDAKPHSINQSNDFKSHAYSRDIKPPSVDHFNESSYESCDSCSDYELHCDADDDDLMLPCTTWQQSELNTPKLDSGVQRYTFVSEMAEKLDKLFRTGALDKDLPFVLLFSNIIDYISHRTVDKNSQKCEWNSEVVDFCFSILYLGGRKTYNFIRGPGNHGRGKTTLFDVSKFNIPLPDERTCRRKAPGFSTSPGIVRELLASNLKLAQASSVTPLITNEHVTIVPVALQSDGVALKPGLELDQNKKVLVGATIPIDLEYTK